MTNFKIVVKDIELRLARVEDAELVVRLRRDVKNMRHIHSTDPSIEVQRKWLAEYKKREAFGLEYYFVCGVIGRDVGLMRLYDLRDNAFTSGSWVFEGKAAWQYPIVANLIAKVFGYQVLKKDFNYFGVQKANKRVLEYNLMFKPEIIKENEKEIHFVLSRKAFFKHAPKVARLVGWSLPADINKHVCSA